ncbi:MAG: DegV family protein [Bacillota bacterium]
MEEGGFQDVCESAACTQGAEVPERAAIRVVTDSAASLSKEVQEKEGISVIPIYIQVGPQTYREGQDISAQEFYQKLDSSEEVPTTSGPPPGEFAALYRKIAQSARQILSIHVTGAASATCHSARLAAQAVPEAQVTVYDSRSVSMGTGFLAIEAARAARQGLSVEEIVQKLDAIRSKLRVFAAIPTLKYLRRSGRVTQGQAILASLLSIKPVIEIVNGQVELVDKVRSYSRALERVVELAVKAAGRMPVHVAVMHANCLDEARRFAETVKQRLNVKQLLIGEVGAALAVHGGPGMIGIVFYPAE